MMISTNNNEVASTGECTRLSAPYANERGGKGSFEIPDAAREEKASGTSAPRVGVEFPLWKRILDLCLILIGLPLWLPIALLVAVVIRLGSRGPIFFCQERVGRGGRLFTCYKFRTMRMNACPSAHQSHVKDLMKSSSPMVKLDDEKDARVIPGGAWVRASGLDELPQIFNILRGEMSIVGPRPCIPYEYQMYEPWQQRRCDAPPGLTGLWQVSGKNRTTFNQMVQFDISYARRMSPWLDLGIVVRTPMAILQQVIDTRLAKRARRKQDRNQASVRDQSKF